MISRLTELEQQRIENQGYDTVVIPHEITVTSPRTVIEFGNESWILTGVRASSADLMGADHSVSITSPTNAFYASQRTLASMGTSLLRLFRHHMIIHVAEYGKDFDSSASIPSFTLSFMRIAPVVRSTYSTSTTTK